NDQFHSWESLPYAGLDGVFTIHALGKGTYAIQRRDGRYLSRSATDFHATTATSIGPNETFEILSVQGTSEVVIRQGDYTFSADVGDEINVLLAADTGGYSVFEISEVLVTEHQP